VLGHADGGKALNVSLQLVKMVDERQFKVPKGSRLPTSAEDGAQDFVGYSELSTADFNKTKALEDVEPFAGYLDDMYVKRPVVPSWAGAEARCEYKY
jgi:hypothetical protein